MQSFPLKFKLMLILVGLSVVILLTYAFLALSDFKSDKIAYVFDATLSHSRSTATQLRSDLDFMLEKVEFYMRGYQTEQHDFHPYSRTTFAGEKRLSYLASYTTDPSSGQYGEKAVIVNAASTPAEIESVKALATTLIKDVLQSKVGLRPVTNQPGKWILGVRIEDKSGGAPFVVIGLVTKSGFLESFTNSQLQDTFLLGGDGGVILEPIRSVYTEVPRTDIDLAQKKILEALATTPEATKEIKTKSRSGNVLASGAQVGIGDLKVMSIIPLKAALEALWMLAYKSAAFILLLVCVAVFVSVLGSNQLTAPLNTLFQATKKISEGDFDIDVDIKSRDEIGGLAEGFNRMAKEIERLLAETAEKARMKSELQTAQLVQSTLFPPKEYKSHTIEIQGFYEPASECGGDWWFYNQIGNKTYLWIGDATGHGVPAALVTAAARSAANVVQEFPDLSPSKLMEMLNRAIYGTSKGQVLMTFFLAVYDNDSREFTYCNASHDPPYMFPAQDGPLKKSNIIPLMDGVGPRLGEDADRHYDKIKLTLNPGDRIMFYTDGVTELRDKNGGMLGERKFLKGLMDSFNAGKNVEKVMQDLAGTISEFRGEAPLNDDVTYFIFQVNGPT